MPRPKSKALGAVKPNAGLSAKYEKSLDALVDAMSRSVEYWLRAAYNAKPPATMAQDAKYDGSPAAVMKRTMKRLAKTWQKQFDEAAPALADYFSKAFADRTDAQLSAILRKGGLSVKFKMTAGMRDVINANITANVELITNISEQYLSDVTGAVMRSVAAGRDIGNLMVDLEKRLGITKRRARLIAHHQNNLATGQMQKQRYKELGIKEVVWCHSAGGKEPRPSHVKAGQDKLRYDPEKGAYIDGEYIFPGELINCRCFCKPVIAGF